MDRSTRIAKVEHEKGQYTELKDKLSSIMVREEEGPLEMLTDLGADCFAKVKVRAFFSVEAVKTRREDGRNGLLSDVLLCLSWCDSLLPRLDFTYLQS